jgi:hypothetical protein
MESLAPYSRYSFFAAGFAAYEKQYDMPLIYKEYNMRGYHEEYRINQSRAPH